MTHAAAPIPRASSHGKKSLEDDDLDDGGAKTPCVWVISGLLSRKNVLTFGASARGLLVTLPASRGVTRTREPTSILFRCEM